MKRSKQLSRQTNLSFIKKNGLFFILLVISSFGYGQIKQVHLSKQLTGFQAVESGFITVPDSIQTSVYWYWISGNISKEGVVKDLEAMKKVGITRAFIGNIGLDNIPGGKVKMFTDEWWDILH